MLRGYAWEGFVEFICRLFNLVDFTGRYSVGFSGCSHNFWVEVIGVDVNKKRYQCSVGVLGGEKRLCWVTEAELDSFDSVVMESVLS